MLHTVGLADRKIYPRQHTAHSREDKADCLPHLYYVIAPGPSRYECTGSGFVAALGSLVRWRLILQRSTWARPAGQQARRDVLRGQKQTRDKTRDMYVHTV